VTVEFGGLQLHYVGSRKDPIMSHHIAKRTVVALSAAAFVLALAACGGSTKTSTVAPAVSAVAGKAGAFNDADVAFAQGMIPHHEQAIEMADIALDPTVGAGGKITALAKAIKAAQDPEIKTMKAWLTAWGKDASGGMAGMDHSGAGAMPGMMSADDMTKLGKAKGPEFDTMWATMMIAHHKGAIEQANTEIKSGSSAEAKALAAAIVKAQAAEIATMTPLAKA
jgi:uncharacterized protein (DUF305 family)